MKKTFYLNGFSMFGGKKFRQEVMGHEISSPKPTKWAYFYILKYAGIPICFMLLAFDMILYFVFKYGFNSCYGVFCLLN